MMLTDDVRTVFLCFGLSAAAACTAGAGPGAQQPPAGAPNGAPAPAAFGAELRAAPPSPAPGAPGAASAPSAAAPPSSAAAPNTPAAPGTAAPAPPVSATPASGAAGSANPALSDTPARAGIAAAPASSVSASASGELECVVPPDPELDQESPWSRQIGQRLDRELAKLQRCTADLPPDEQSLTLRLVYAKDGSSISQHVVSSTPGACAATECLKRALAEVKSPVLLIDKASIDLNLALSAARAPERRSEPVDPLSPEPPADGSESCVDADVGRLSRATVREVVSLAYDSLQKCYALGLQRDHALAGKVSFEFVIGQDGAVPEAWARESTLPDCEAIRCMLTTFRALHFPEPVGRSVRVQYPISYVVEQSPVTLR